MNLILCSPLCHRLGSLVQTKFIRPWFWMFYINDRAYILPIVVVASYTLILSHELLNLILLHTRLIILMRCTQLEFIIVWRYNVVVVQIFLFLRQVVSSVCSTLAVSACYNSLRMQLYIIIYAVIRYGSESASCKFVFAVTIVDVGRIDVPLCTE